MSEEVERDQLKEARKIKRAFEDLISCEGWSMLEQIVEAQCNSRISIITRTPVLWTEVTKQEFMKGEVAGLSLVLVLAKGQLEQATELVEGLTDVDD